MVCNSEKPASNSAPHLLKRPSRQLCELLADCRNSTLVEKSSVCIQMLRGNQAETAELSKVKVRNSVPCHSFVYRQAVIEANSVTTENLCENFGLLCWDPTIGRHHRILIST